MLSIARSGQKSQIIQGIGKMQRQLERVIPNQIADI
jgi:hypothetical protein